MRIIIWFLNRRPNFEIIEDPVSWNIFPEALKINHDEESIGVYNNFTLYPLINIEKIEVITK